jgi:hypothetical protein
MFGGLVPVGCGARWRTIQLPMLRVILPPLALAFAFLAVLYFHRARQWSGWNLYERERRLCFCASSVAAVVAVGVLIWWYREIQTA